MQLAKVLTSSEEVDECKPLPPDMGEGAATGRWLAAGMRAAASGGGNDVLAATLESLLPSPRARTAAPHGRKYANTPPPPPPLPPPPPPLSPGAPHVARLAAILAAPLAGFLFPDHAVPVLRVLVDIAVQRGGNGME
jgi:hypothetical protein